MRDTHAEFSLLALPPAVVVPVATNAAAAPSRAGAHQPEHVG